MIFSFAKVVCVHIVHIIVHIEFSVCVHIVHIIVHIEFSFRNG